MKIAIDARSAQVEKATGVENYTKFLIEKLPAYDTANEYFLLKQNGWPAALWFNLYLPWQLIKNKIDVFHSPITRFPIWLPKKIKKILTVHDLTWEYYPELYPESELKVIKNKVVKNIKQADVILTISETTKKDLLKFYNLDEQKIVVTAPVLERKEIKNREINPKYKIDFNYLLFVGTLYPRKNIKIVVEALKDVDDLHLILIGKEGFEKDKIMNQAGNKVHHLGYVPEDDLPALYQQATAFVFPSLYEGFGLPLMDAFYYQTPVIASDIEIFKEVGGEACLFFNPKDKAELIEKIKQVQKSREDLIERGKKQLKKFSPDKLLQTTIKGYRQ